MSSFFAEKGSKILVFFYGETDTTSSTSNTTSTATQGQNVKGKSVKSKLQIIQSSSVMLKGICIFFVRHTTSIAITSSNISQETFFGSYDCQNESILQAISRQFSDLFIPILSNMADASWGKMAAKVTSQQANTAPAPTSRDTTNDKDMQMSKEGQIAKIEFLGKLNMFVSTLQGAQESISERIVFKQSDKIDLGQINTSSDYLTVAASIESLGHVEDIVKVWKRQIEVILAESEQIRREADNIGPRAELDYWKSRTSKFNYLLDQVKSHEVKAALGVLQAAKSRLLGKWKELDMKITDSANEARDNVKYLYTLERFCDPLYNSDPVSMLSDIPGLINAIKMIHSISMYYNTSERMTSLFLKVTNQMIIACKAYVSENGTQTVWSQPQASLLRKLKDCIKLNKEYQACFQRTKEKIAQMPDQRPFDFSEMYIFGKFDTFTRRCEKIIDVFNTINQYVKLTESKIEGVDLLAAKFNGTVNTLRKKTYDFLDQRKQEFDSDYEDFKRGIQELQV